MNAITKTCHKPFQEFSSGGGPGQTDIFSTAGLHVLINFKGNSNFLVWSIFGVQ